MLHAFGISYGYEEIMRNTYKFILKNINGQAEFPNMIARKENPYASQYP